MQTQSTDAARDDQEPLDLKKPSTFGDIARSIGSRNLMIIIVTMPLVFLAVVAGIIAVFGGGDDAAVATAPAAVAPVSVERLAEPAPLAAQTSGATPATTVAADPSAIGLAAGSGVTAMSLDGDRLALRVDGPDGVSIVIYDLSAGAVVQRIPVTQGRSN